MRAPERIPEQPRPAMALPPMKVGELWAIAQITDPISRKATHVRKINLCGNIGYSFPMKAWVAPVTISLQIALVLYKLSP